VINWEGFRQVAEKERRSLLQGLKPIYAVHFTQGLKPRPPKEWDFFQQARRENEEDYRG
jgi:hypothetical protein